MNKKILFVICVAIWFIQPARLLAESWAEGQMERINSVGDNVSERELLMLARLSGGDSYSPEDEEVRRKARARLTSIPDFADRLADYARIEPSADGDVDLRTRMWVIKAMKNVPHPDIVRVLGEFLTDYTGSFKTTEILDSYMGANCHFAVRSLAQLIDNQPVKKHWDSQGELDAPDWQLWYEQVKAGNRTFRFIGDPTEYDLNGPASKEKLERIRQHRERDELRAANQQKSGRPVTEADARNEASEGGFPVKGVLAAMALLGAAGWYAFRLRSKNTGAAR